MGNKRKNKKKTNIKDARGYSTGESKSKSLSSGASKVKQTSTVVRSGSSHNKKGVQSLLSSASDLETLKELVITPSSDEYNTNHHDSNHNDNLLETVKSRNGASYYQMDNKRLVTKLTNLYQSLLLQFHFTDDQTQLILKKSCYLLETTNNDSNGNSLSLEYALDWACWNLSTEELPTLFTDANIVQWTSDTNNNNELTVVMAPKTTKQSNSNENTIPQSISSDTTIQAPLIFDQSKPQTNKINDDTSHSNNNKKELDKDTKQWILAQYYENQDEDEYDIASEKMVTETKDQANGKIDCLKSNIDSTVPSSEKEGNDVVVVDSYLENKLKLLKEEVTEDEALLNNEASLYMMSKFEVKELKKALGKKKGQLKKLQNKYEEKIRIHTQMQRETNPINSGEKGNETVEEDEEDYCGFGLFESGEDDEQSVDVVNKENKTSTPLQEKHMCDEVDDSNIDEISNSQLRFIPNTDILSIPKNWTGQTPTTILRDLCKKQSYGKPIFQKLPSSFSGGKNGCKLTIKTNQRSVNAKTCKTETEDSTSSSIQIEEYGPFFSFQDAQHFVSTIALYEIDRNKPLYHMLPPIFRDLWKDWLNEEKSKQYTETQSKQLVLDEKIRCIIESVHQWIAKDGETTLNSSNRNKNHTLTSDKWDKEDDFITPATSMNESKVDDWEEVGTNSMNDNDSFHQIKSRCTERGLEMKKEYLHRQNTNATYEKMIEFRSMLPIHNFKKKLLDTIGSHSVTVLCAETGAGKTTQCPQFLLEDAILAGFGDQISILCTQPRRISAISVAERVADEMCENDIGKLVGYQIRMESRKSNHTKLVFCTTGVVLRRLQEDPNLEGITHVIVDEVHERQWQIDFLLIALRRLINTTRRDLRIILMSATMDARLFCSFFEGAPLISVPGRTFPVEEYFLEDLLDATDHVIEEGSKYAIQEYRGVGGKTSMWVTGRGGEKRRQNVSLESELESIEISDDFVGYKISTRRSLERVNEKVINYDLIEDVLKLLIIEPERNQTILPPKESGRSLPNGSILIFLPGMGEIRTLTERLKYSRIFGDEQRFILVPMHSTISSEDQKKAFMKPKKGSRKIILATNIAETSVTIPDVVCVIDCGLMREIRQDKRSGVSTLVTDFCSKANCKQRSGRAGRVQPGICCKLYSSKTATRTMKDQNMPELQRVPLEEICLNILAGKLSNNCTEFLNQAPQAPSETSVAHALIVLDEVGAIEDCKEIANKQIDEPRLERLTPLGYHLAKLPVDVRLGKMLIFGTLFKCLDKVLTIAASLSTKSPFSSKSFDQSSQQMESVHKTFAHPTSDFLTLCNVWYQYCAERKQSYSSARKFCSKNFLNYTALVEIGDMRIHFLELLSQIGFIPPKRGKWHDFNLNSSQYDIHSNNDDIVNAVICAGLYPNIAQAVKSRVGDPPILWHKNEQLYFHSSSINHHKVDLESEWVVFHEKFATRKVFVTATSLIKPFGLLLFAKSIKVIHTERKVVIDDWIELNIAAQIGVMFRELQKKVTNMLKDMITNINKNDYSKDRNSLIEGIVKLLSS